MKILTFFAIFIGKCDQRSMILTNWFGNGVRNVRYMTVANNFIDTKGVFIIHWLTFVISLMFFIKR